MLDDFPDLADQLVLFGFVKSGALELAGDTVMFHGEDSPTFHVKY